MKMVSCQRLINDEKVNDLSSVELERFIQPQIIKFHSAVFKPHQVCQRKEVSIDSSGSVLTPLPQMSTINAVFYAMLLQAHLPSKEHLVSG
jgi:hypothetical protein